MDVRAGVELPLQVKLLGPVQVRRDDIDLPLRSIRLQCMVGVLATRLGSSVSRAELIDAIWGDQPPASAENAVHVHVARLRGLLEPARGHRAPAKLLAWTGSGYLLRLRPDQLDVRVFDAQCDWARRATAAGDLEDALRRYDIALELWCGTPWSGVPGPFADAERTRLIEHRLTVLETRAEIMLGLGRHSEIAAELPPLIDSYPLREQLRALHMRALYQCGRQAEALQVFRETRRAMVRELGIEPGPELRQTHEAILRSDPSLLWSRNAALGTSPSAGGTERTATTDAVPRQLPAGPWPFVGRTAELAQLTSLLDEAETARAAAAGTVVIMSIGGPAGIGKTTLAVHWAHQVTPRFPDGQLYIDLRGFDPSGTPTQPTAAIRRFLDAFDVPTHRIQTDLDAQIALYRSLLADKRMLIVLDNARDSEQVRPLLPGTPDCLTLITSRDQLTGLVAIEGARPLTLDLPSTVEARDLLVGRLGAKRAAAEPAAVDEIVTRCARLPLALAIAAARASLHPKLRLVDIAAELTDSRHRLDALNTGDTIADIRAVFSWSYRALSPPAARLFRLLGLHPGPDVTAPAAASLVGEPAADARPLLSELARAHLIIEHAPGRYALHDLLRAYATEQTHATDGDGHRWAATRRMLDHYLHTAYAADRLLNPTRDPITLPAPAPATTTEDLAGHEQAIDWFTTEHPVLLAAVDRAATTGHDRQTWQLAWTISRFLAQQGHWHDRATIGRLAVTAASRLGDPTAEARARDNLANAYIELGHYDDAHAHLREALELLCHAGDQAWQANMHMSLGRLRERLGRHAEALEHARQALTLYRAAGHRVGHGNALNAIGWCQAWLGDYRSALSACQEALTLFQELGIRHAEADTWDSLGYVRHGLGHYTQAITCYQNALDLHRDRGNRNYEAATLSRLGDTHHATGDHRAAESVWQQALAILHGLDHPDAERIRAKLRDLRK